MSPGNFAFFIPRFAECQVEFILGTISAIDPDGDPITYAIKAINELPRVSIDNVTVTEGDGGTVDAELPLQ